MWNLVVMSISRQLVFQWVLIVPHWWQICSYIPMKLILYNIYKRVSSRSKQKHLTFRYLDVLSLNNPKFNDYIDVIYPKELETKYTTDAPKWVNNMDLHLEFVEDGKLFTRLYDKRDDFDFPIDNFPYLSSNTPESPALHMVSLFHSWYVMLGFVRNMKNFCSEDLFWFQSDWSRDILHVSLDYFSEIPWSSYRPCSQIWQLCVTYFEWFVH